MPKLPLKQEEAIRYIRRIVPLVITAQDDEDQDALDGVNQLMNELQDYYGTRGIYMFLCGLVALAYLHGDDNAELEFGRDVELRMYRLDEDGLEQVEPEDVVPPVLGAARFIVAVLNGDVETAKHIFLAPWRAGDLESAQTMVNIVLNETCRQIWNRYEENMKVQGGPSNV